MLGILSYMLRLIDDSMKYPRTYSALELETTDSPKQTALKVCRIPFDPDKPLADRVVQSGYLHHPERITTELLECVLRSHPDLMTGWTADDKRCTETWYILPPQKDKPRWEVGYVPDGPRKYFEDAFVACAHYIKLDMEQNAAWVRMKVRPIEDVSES